MPVLVVRFFLAPFALLLITGNARAQDVGAIVEQIQLARYSVEPGEKAVAHTSGSQPHVTLTRFGRWLVMLDGYDANYRRVWRSPPLPVAACLNQRQSIWLSALKHDRLMVSFTHCPHDQWFRSSKGGIASFAANAPERLTVWAGDANQVAAELGEALREQSISDTTLRRIAAPDQFTVIAPPAAAALAPLIADTTPPRALAASAVAPRFEAVLTRLDWREAALPVSALNNLAFALTQSHDCANAREALLMFAAVARRAPERAVAHLNLADGLAQLATEQCRPEANGLGDVKMRADEEYRLYCAGLGPSQVPRRTAARIARALGVPQLDAVSCHPQLAIFRAIDAYDAAALATALDDPFNYRDLIGPDQRTPLQTAIEARHGALARQLIAHGVDVDRSGSDYVSPINSAIYALDVETVAALAAAKARLEGSAHLAPPLNVAASLFGEAATSVKLELVEILLAAGASPTLTNEDHENALYAAASGYGPPALIARLAAAGAYVNLPNRYGRSPLFAVGPFDIERAIATLSALLAAGANPNQQDHQGETPLVYGFGYSHAHDETLAAMVKLLVSHGADPNIESAEGETALTRAARRAMPETVEWLLAHGARIPEPRAGETLLAAIKRRAAEADADCGCKADYARIANALANAGAR